MCFSEYILYFNQEFVKKKRKIAPVKNSKCFGTPKLLPRFSVFDVLIVL